MARRRIWYVMSVATDITLAEAMKTKKDFKNREEAEDYFLDHFYDKPFICLFWRWSK